MTNGELKKHTSRAGFRIVLSDDFMRHFRWITPLLLLLLNVIVALAVFIGKEFVDEVREMKTDVIQLKINVARIDGTLAAKESLGER